MGRLPVHLWIGEVGARSELEQDGRTATAERLSMDAGCLWNREHEHVLDGESAEIGQDGACRGRDPGPDA